LPFGVLLWAFWCRKLLEWNRIVEGKMLKEKIAEGKRIIEGKCQREEGTIAEGKMLKRG
jgi:hypothetical protein